MYYVAFENFRKICNVKYTTKKKYQDIQDKFKSNLIKDLIGDAQLKNEKVTAYRDNGATFLLLAVGYILETKMEPFLIGLQKFLLSTIVTKLDN